MGAVLCAFLCAACSRTADGPKNVVEMREAHRFVPSPLRVVQGTTVTFVNESSQAHTITAYEDRIPADAQYFASGDFATEAEAREGLADGIIGQEGSYEVTFGV